MFKNGTKIFFTVGNYNKVLESILFQTFSTISPQFRCIAVILKKFIMDLNDERFSTEKKNKHLKTQFKWITIIFVLVAYMQDRKLLPVLQEAELIKINSLLLESKDSNIDEETTHKSQGLFSRLNKEILNRIDSTAQFYKRNLRLFENEEKEQLGKLLIEFLTFLTGDFQNSTHPMR
jgi:hypothetical protein